MRSLKVLIVVLALALSAIPATAVTDMVPAPVSSDPTGIIASDNMKVLGTIPEPAVISARFRGNVMYVSSLTGLTTYDISDPAAPQRLGRLALPHFQNEDVDLGGNILLISNDAAESRGVLYVVDISDPANPTLKSQLDMGGNPVQGGPGHTATCVQRCRFAWVTDGGGIRVIDLRDPANPKDLGTQPTPAGGLVTHDVQRDGNGLYWVAGFDGLAGYRLPKDYDGQSLGTLVTTTNDKGKSRYAETFGLDDGSTYNDFILHNSLRRKGSDVVYVTEEDYTRPGCRGAGSFQRWKLPVDKKGNPTGKQLRPMDMWSTEMDTETASPSAVCSAHYFDERKGLIAHGWYQQGLRLLDVSGDQIRQVGYYITPEILAWGAYFPPNNKAGDLVYVLNASRGIDILKIDRPKHNRAMPTVTAPVLPQWKLGTATLRPSRQYGFACALPV
ncbi:MAG TPA: hypothetical protein VM307_01310 [Egibacteraceae bacterium]|nr:hypothetical protein [Egibacteraceae bacterium]